ncbi:MAG: cytidylyltransferase domain-containing protein [Anaerovoracaceae bacterium]
MKILITICGRAGSKGVKQKNLLKFDGYPLVYYSCASALRFAELVDEDVDICISSDSHEILEVANKFNGICSMLRPDDLCTDTAGKLAVIQFTTERMEEECQIIYDYVIDLDITSPLRNSQDIFKAYKKSRTGDSDVVFSVVSARRNPYFNMIEDINGEIRKIKNDTFLCRQDCPKVFDMNASIYCYKRYSLMNNLKYNALDCKFDYIEMKDTHVIDIDHNDDLFAMELLYKNLYKEEYKFEIEKYLLIDNGGIDE